jgi:maltose O-acetyltransferase
LVIDDPSDRRYTLTIGDRASVSPRVTFVLHSQPNDSRIVPYVNSIRGSITVGPDAWVGTGAVVLPGISIGEGAVVGANAVVTRDVPAYTVVAGVPAHRLRTVKVPWNIPQEINND